MKLHVYIYDSFSSFLSVYQSLYELATHCKGWFLIKQIASLKCVRFSVQKEELNSYGEFVCKHTTCKKGIGHQNG